MKLTKLLREVNEESPEKKQEGLKYECKYLNGGFNDGVKIEPTDGGKLSLAISIYGGGDPKKVNIPASPEIQKIIRGYEVAFKQNDPSGTKLEPRLDEYIESLTQELSYKVMDAMRELDEKVKQIIIETIKGTQ